MQVNNYIMVKLGSRIVKCETLRKAARIRRRHEDGREPILSPTKKHTPYRQRALDPDFGPTMAKHRARYETLLNWMMRGSVLATRTVPWAIKAAE